MAFFCLSGFDRHQSDGVRHQSDGHRAGAPPDHLHHAAAQQNDQPPGGAADRRHLAHRHSDGAGAHYGMELRVQHPGVLEHGAALQPQLPGVLGRAQPADLHRHGGRLHAHLRLRASQEPPHEPAHLAGQAQGDGGQPHEDRRHDPGSVVVILTVDVGINYRYSCCHIKRYRVSHIVASRLIQLPNHSSDNVVSCVVVVSKCFRM